MRIGQKGGGGGGFGWVVRVEPGRVPGRKGAYSGKRGEGGRGADGSCASVQSMQSCPVQATLTELRRKTGKVLGPVIHAGKSVDITSQGQIIASIQPQLRGISGDDLARLWESGPRLGPELAEEVAQNLKECDQAEYARQRSA